MLKLSMFIVAFWAFFGTKTEARLAWTNIQTSVTRGRTLFTLTSLSTFEIIRWDKYVPLTVCVEWHYM